MRAVRTRSRQTADGPVGAAVVHEDHFVTAVDDQLLDGPHQRTDRIGAVIDRDDETERWRHGQARLRFAAAAGFATAALIGFFFAALTVSRLFFSASIRLTTFGGASAAVETTS